MSKHREPHQDVDIDDDALRDVVNEIEYSLDDDEFFEQFEPKRTRKNTRRKRNARRRIDEYWEDRQLAERITEYYDDPYD